MIPDFTMKRKTKNARETKALAKQILKNHPNHKIWLLYGDLGAGKTTFVKGLGRALGLRESQIKSPTFTFVVEFEPLIHYDLYRLDALDDLTLELLNEHLATGKRVVIEWPEKIESHLTFPHLKIRFSHEGGDQRSIEIS